MSVEASTVVCAIEHWMRHECPDYILADILIEFGEDALGKRLNMLAKHKGKRLRQCTSTVTRDLFRLMPRLRLRRRLQGS